MRRSILAGFLFLILLAVSCKNDVKTDTADAILNIAVKKDPKRINPILAPTQSAKTIFQYVFLPLADYDPQTLELTPIMIKELPVRGEITEGAKKGQVTYTFEMREDAVWEDGSAIDGEDYVFTIKAILHPETGAGAYRSYFKNIADVQVDPQNAKKVTVFFDEPYMLDRELVSTLEVYPKHVYDPTGVMDAVKISDLKDAENIKQVFSENTAAQDFAKVFNSVKYSREVIEGAGPYRVKEWISDQLVVLERKENHWGKGKANPFLLAGPQQMLFHIIPDEVSVMSQLKEGKIDLLPNASAQGFLDLKDNEKYKDGFQFFTPEVMRNYCIYLNNKSPELADNDARRALAHLVDVDEIVSLLEHGMARRNTGIFNVNRSYYNKSLPLVNEDIAKAKAILDDEGWTDTNGDGTIDKKIGGKRHEFELDMYTTGSDYSNKVALLMQENFKKVSIKLNIIEKKFSVFRKENLAKRDYDLFTSAYNQEVNPDDPYSKWHSENDTPTGQNITSYHSAKADQIIEEIRVTHDPKKRKELYLALQEVMYDDQPIIPLYHPLQRIILSKKWNGSASTKRPGYFANTFTPSK